MKLTGEVRCAEHNCAECAAKMFAIENNVARMCESCETRPASPWCSGCTIEDHEAAHTVDQLTAEAERNGEYPKMPFDRHEHCSGCGEGHMANCPKHESAPKTSLLEAERDLLRRCLGRLFLALPEGCPLEIDRDTAEQAVLAGRWVESSQATNPAEHQRVEESIQATRAFAAGLARSRALNPDEPELVAKARAAASRMAIRANPRDISEEGWPSADADVGDMADAFDELERRIRKDQSP